MLRLTGMHWIQQPENAYAHVLHSLLRIARSIWWYFARLVNLFSIWMHLDGDCRCGWSMNRILSAWRPFSSLWGLWIACWSYRACNIKFVYVTLIDITVTSRNAFLAKRLVQVWISLVIDIWSVSPLVLSASDPDAVALAATVAVARAAAASAVSVSVSV